MSRLICLFILASIPAFGTTPRVGIAVDAQSHAPVSFVVATHEKTGYWIVSNSVGRISFDNRFDAGDTVQIHRYGYLSQQIQLPEEITFQIQLKPDPVVMSSIVKIGTSHSAMTHSFTLEQLPFTDPSRQRDIFSQLPGLTIRTYGSPGSIGLISVDGGSASHTSVYFHDFPLSNTQTGMTDLSQIPRGLIRNVSVTSGGQLDGYESINIEGDNQDHLYTETGSFGHRSIQASKRFYVRNNEWTVHTGFQQDDGDFTAVWNNRDVRRTNNDFTQSYLSFRGLAMPNPSSIFQFMGLYSGQRRGNPGQIWSPSKSRRNDELIMAGLSTILIHARGSHRFTAMIKTQTDKVTDPSILGSSTHDLTSYLTSLSSKISLTRDWIYRHHISLSLDTLTSSNAGNHARYSLTVFPGVEFHSPTGFSLRASVKGTMQNNRTPLISQSVSAFLDRGKLEFNAHYQKISRNPTLNEMYWFPGGKPDLKPEQLHHARGWIGLMFSKHASVTLEGYIKQGENLIQWVPATTYWQPKNLKETYQIGMKGRVEWRVRQWLHGSFAFNRMKSEYRVKGNHSGKSMTYAPDYLVTNRFHWNLTSTIEFWTYSYLMGPIISRYDWPSDLILQPVTYHDLNLSTTFDLSGHETILTTTIHNLTNSQFEMSQGYPEMGRSYLLSLGITL